MSQLASPIVALARRLSAPLVRFCFWSLEVAPWLRKLDWLLEVELLTRRHPVLLSLSMFYVAYRGVRTTSLGHIGTDPIIYPLLGAISGFNPFLGIVCAGLFAIADLAQKLVWPDIYGARGWSDLNYWGAMGGYVVAYSSVATMALLPGMMSRIFRKVIGGLFRKTVFARASSGADGATPAVGGAAYVANVLAGAAGGYFGGYITMNTVAPVAEMPAFLWRPQPDISCHRLEVDTHLQGRAWIGGSGGAIGGIVPTIMRGGSDAPPTPEGTEADEAKQGWIEQRKQDLKGALDMKANLEAARRGYGGSGFDTSEHDRQIADMERRIADLRGGLAAMGAGYDYTPAAHDPIGPGREFVDAVNQNKAIAEEQREIAIRLEEARIEARKGLAAEQERLEAAQQAASDEVNSYSGITQDILVETTEDARDLIVEGGKAVIEAGKDVWDNPAEITKDTLTGMVNDFKEIADKAAELERQALDAVADAQEEAVTTVIETTKDAWENPDIYREAAADTLRQTTETIVEGAVAVGEAEISVLEAGKDMIMHPIDILLPTVTSTASDVNDLRVSVTKVIGEHARDHEKRNAFIKNVSGYNDLGKAMDPNLPLEQRLGHGVVGGAKIALTAHGLAAGTARAVAGQVVAKVATHAAAVNAVPLIETAKQIHSLAKAMGIPLGDTKAIGRIADLVLKYGAPT